MKTDAARRLFMEKLDVDEEIADILIAEGLNQPGRSGLCAAAGNAGDQASTRTRSTSCARAPGCALDHGNRERKHGRRVSGFARSRRPDARLIAKLAAGGVNTRDDLADLGLDELTD